jgi:hypothetical protein
MKVEQPGASSFTELSDVPHSYAGAGSKFVTVEVTETGLEFTTGGTGSVGTLQEVTDLGTTTTNDIEITDTTKGVIIKSANGTRWRIGITNSGELTATSL